jgi:exonuclease SbcD
MIKFFHTADLHLGKVLHEQTLIEDQKYMLAGLVEILRDESYSALVIAGDVYDRSIPSPEAVELFSSFLVKLKSIRPGLAIIIIPGNHDSPVRLGFGRELFAGLGIHFAPDSGDAHKPVIVKNGNDGCAFFLLPFQGRAGFGETAARLEEARRLCAASGTKHSVLAAHFFASGGSESGSERIFLGGAERTDMNLFSRFSYVALGHLHRFQRAGKNGWYSGSPLAYSFGEAESGKCFLSVTLDREGSEPLVEPVPVKPLRRLVRLRGPFMRFLTITPDDDEAKGAKNDYVEIILTGRHFSENALSLLRKNFPFLLSVNQEEAFSVLEKTLRVPGIIPGEKKDLESDFGDFLRFLYGKAEPEKLALFRSLAEDSPAEENA